MLINVNEISKYESNKITEAKFPMYFISTEKQNLLWGGGGVLAYLAKRGCAALMGHFFTRNP